MIAIDLADLVGAESECRGIWTAKCPICKFSLLKITGSRYMIGELRCNGGCSIYQILRALGLSRDDLAARPQTVPPDFESMEASDRRAYDAGDRMRQRQHKMASEQFRCCRRDVVRLKREIKAVTASYVPLTLTLKLQDAEEALTRARRKEKRLRG